MFDYSQSDEANLRLALIESNKDQDRLAADLVEVIALVLELAHEYVPIDPLNPQADPLWNKTAVLLAEYGHAMPRCRHEDNDNEIEPTDGMSDEDAFTSAGFGMDESYGNYDEGYADFHGGY